MERMGLLAGIRYIPVRDRVRRFFNPEGFDVKGFRNMVMLGLMGVLLGELVVYIMLKQSAELGELPHYITDALIVGISSLEFLLGPVIGWLGSGKRRRVMMIWVSLALLCTVPMFGLPSPETTPDAGLCSTAIPLTFPSGISLKAGVRLSLLLICALACALARLALMSHGLAYINEFSPSDNLHMHVAVFLLHKILLLVIGNAMMKQMTLDMPWLQVLIITIKFLIILLQLVRYPEVAPTVDKRLGSDRGLLRSILRVVSSPVAMLQIIAMSLLTAAFWGFGINEVDFVKAKYHIVTSYEGQMSIMNINFIYLPVVMGVLLAGYMYTGPVMPKYDKKAAVCNATKMSLFTVVVYVMMTAWLGCSQGQMVGLERGYSQPACAQNCGCDRPWMEFTPVCVPEQMSTYFSPCHAGCATADTLNSQRVYSNCTCAPGGRVIVGPCDDGSCADTYSFHQTLFVVASLTTSLALVWQGTVVIESVDRRDVSVAVGLASGIISLFAFVGAHGFYLGISSYTCAFRRGSKCLFPGEQFAPWVGYSSVTLAGLAMLAGLVSVFVVRRQKEPKDSSEDLGMS